ncbi:MAG: hypothetical protein RRC34_06985 [Lentisphaeria bacterium]|nr:hypothetical protein [Lentisphaeria bacterium]
MMLKRLFLILFTTGLGMQMYAQEVVLRLSASNPSKITAMDVEVRKILPPRIERADVLDSDGLDVIYDADAKRYRVQKQVTLRPEEKRVFTIRLRDIWTFDEAELIQAKAKAEKIVGILRNTRGKNEAELLRDRIVKNVDAILDLQAERGIDQVSVPEHISAYDRNEVRYEAVQADARDLEAVLSILGDEKILDEEDSAPVNVAMLWKIILLIVSFVAVITVVCFLVWTGQLRKIRQAEREAGIDAE